MIEKGSKKRTPVISTEVPKQLNQKIWKKSGDSAAIRTQDLLLRRQLLYPAELRNHLFSIAAGFVGTPRFELGISCSQSRRDNRTTLYPADVLSFGKKKDVVETSFSLWVLRRRGDSNPRYPNRVRQFSKLLVSATHPPLRLSCQISMRPLSP